MAEVEKVEKWLVCNEKAEEGGSRKELMIPVTSSALTLQRTSSLKKSLLLVALFLLMEVGKQLSNFGLAKSSGGTLPLPTSLIVVVVEAVKLIFVTCWAKVSGESFSCSKPPLKFSVPSGCYFITNCLYLIALTKTTPPIWLVLIQSRTLYTALLYRIVFRREVKLLQIVGCFLIVGSIPITKMSELKFGHALLFEVVVMSQVCAVLSTIASVFIEILLKNEKRSFCEQQTWLYFWGVLMASSVYLVTESQSEVLLKIKDLLARSHVLMLFVAAVLSSAMGGLCVPLIVKNLDTIVKDYLAALNSIIISVLTALLFPLYFTFNWLYILALSVLLCGIYCYEKKHLQWTEM